jgi:hypothetical protein
VNEPTDTNLLGSGAELELIQRPARQRTYELRHGDQVIASLRFPVGRRSPALAVGDATGPLLLVATAGRVEVRKGPDSATMIATVERARRGAAALHLVGGPTLRWRRTGPRHRWAIDGGADTLLGFAAHRRRLRSSVAITAHQELPWPTAVLLGLMGGFLALAALQAEADASAAVPGIVAAGPV